MLIDIKEMMSKYDFVDKYDGYQLIANLWEQSLTHDMEVIEANGFYEAGKMREANMVTKGSGDKKRQEQNGWSGVIVPNELISKNVFENENIEIEKLNNRIEEIENNLAELLEKTKEEGTLESDALSGIYDDEKDILNNKKIKEELKNFEKGSDEYMCLKNVESLFSEKQIINKKIKNSQQELTKAIEDKIINLTNEEVDKIMFLKWFGGLQADTIQLVNKPIHAELDTLKMLDERYSETLDEIEKQEMALEKQIEEMMKELV